MRTRAERRARRRGLGFGWSLTILTLVAFGGRVAYVLTLRTRWKITFGDSLYYWGMANALARGHWFAAPSFAPGRYVADASHPPLYSLFLAVVPFFKNGPATPTQLMLWSCALGAVSVLLVGLAGREIAGSRIGLIAAGLAVVYPNMWVHDGMLLSETMAIFVSAGVVLFAYRFARRPSAWRAVWLGVWCALATLARSELVLIVPLLLVPLVLTRADTSWMGRLRWLVAGGAAIVVVMGPWIGYNLARFKEPVYLSTNLSGTLSAANCHDTYYGKTIGFKSYTCGYDYLITAANKHPGFNTMDQSQQDRLVRAEAFRYIRTHLHRLPLIVLAREGRILAVFKPFQEVAVDHGLYNEERTIGRSLVWSFWVMFPLAIVGSFVLRRRRTGVPVWPLWTMPAVVVIAVAFTFAQVRYRAPAEPSFVLLAAVAVDAGARAIAQRRAHRRDVVADQPSHDVGAGVLTP
ncbi:MAG TPA: glycosyltransferase family 39 protein [Acidimicrobiia bacterium]|nr:glycosyltransferase family 39 protein [Acidimicrobiia bacterium]